MTEYKPLDVIQTLQQYQLIFSAILLMSIRKKQTWAIVTMPYIGPRCGHRTPIKVLSHQDNNGPYALLGSHRRGSLTQHLLHMNQN